MRIGDWVGAKLNRLRDCAYGQNVCYLCSGETRREFPPDAKYPRWLYVIVFWLMLLAMIVGAIVGIFVIGWLGELYQSS